MKKYYATAAALAMSVALIAPSVHAVTVDGSGTIEIDANVSAGASASSSSSNQGTNASGSGTIGADVGLITVTRADVSSEESAQVTISTPSAVKTSADLSAYASGVVGGDKNVDAVAASEDSVSVSYKQPAKLFGFIPIFLSATATVKSTGETTVSYPWYAFLATTDSAMVESNVKAATAATLAANAGADAKLSAATQAKLVEEIHAALKSSLEASLAAQGSAGTSVK